MEQVYGEKKDCCGCSACVESCPKNAIVMKADREGFLYPEIDKNLCIDCKICKKVCPMINAKELKNYEKNSFYLAKHKDKNVLKHSTSGGAFTAISDYILKKKGVICGVDFDEKFCVTHKMAETSEERDKFRFSKYVQSNLKDIFQDIKKELIAGKKVLFTGTPCQCAGLKGFMRGSSLAKELYICDLICHSIPSPRIWEEFKKLLEKENGGVIREIHFRTKDMLWSRANSNKTFFFATTEMEKLKLDERFYKMFFGLGTITRPSCSRCPFTDKNRVSDITIADYFGIEEYSPELYDELGLSLIIVNSKKGEEILENIKDDLYLEKRDPAESLKHQQRLSKPMPIPDNREEFWLELDNIGLEKVLEKYGVLKN